jgi:hypothetical protein
VIAIRDLAIQDLQSRIFCHRICNPIKLSTHQLKPISPHIQDLNSWVVLEFFAELCDKDIHAAGVEKFVGTFGKT